MPNIDDSPIARFVRNIKIMGEQRKELEALGNEFSRPTEWRIALEDLAMLTQEKVVIGLRTRWVRRVAVPMVQAYRALTADGDPLPNARKAVQILSQLRGHDDILLADCISWLEETYFLPAAQVPGEVQPCLV